MPELPEVETIRRQLEPSLTHKTIQEIRVFWEKTLSGASQASLSPVLQGQVIRRVRRRGKYFVLELDRGFLVYHLRMSGRLYVSPDAMGEDRWVRLSLTFSDQTHLIFSDTRKFGRVYYDDSLHDLETKLGPEPLKLPVEQWHELFARSKTKIKAFLLNQSKLAGIGNIYSDESLFQAEIHPARPADSLTEEESLRLAKAVQERLSTAIQHEGATISWYRKPDGSQGESQKHFKVYGKYGRPCPVCGKELCRTLVSQRTTTFCSHCQK
ncbi:MAG: DNA-formamidopyrimidine glycosylase [Acidobacteria bacterium]|nr:MAG: DNA-formamidopyrimidine glycosylase [Acidobacteriota bacterium]PIE90797.1 MAG: DNA-formamidopyrimidine glycosylase [Acidobacteriota bacterium]